MRGLGAIVGPLERKQKHGSLKRRTNRIWLLWASGLFAAWRGRIRSNKHSRSAAPLSPGFSVSAGRSRHGPSARARCSIGRGGMSIPMTPLLPWGLQRTAARQRRSQRTSRHRRPGRVISSTGPIARSHVTSGSNRRARLARQGKVVDIGSWPSVVVRAATRSFNTPRLLRATVVRAQSEKRVKRFGAPNGCRSPRARCRASPALASPRAARRVNPAPWHSRASALAAAHSTGRSNTQMEPSRLPVCAILSPRRAAHLQRWTDGQTRTRITRTKNGSLLAAPRIGVICITSMSDSCKWALPSGGALSGFPSLRRVNTRYEPSTRPRCSVGLWGVPITVVSAAHGVAVSRGGAPSAQAATLGHPRRGRVVQAPAPSFVRGYR